MDPYQHIYRIKEATVVIIEAFHDARNRYLTSVPGSAEADRWKREMERYQDLLPPGY